MCLAVFLRNRPRRSPGFGNYPFCDVSRHRQHPDPQGPGVVVCWVGTCGWGEGESSPYEGTAAKYCGWNLGERLHSVVVGRVDLADEAVDAWQHDVLPDATVTLWPNIGVGATGDLSVQSGRTVISVSIRNGPDRTVEQEMAKDTTPQLLDVYQLLPPVK